MKVLYESDTGRLVKTISNKGETSYQYGDKNVTIKELADHLNKPSLVINFYMSDHPDDDLLPTLMEYFDIK